MSDTNAFQTKIKAAYEFQAPSVFLGAAMLDKEVLTECRISAPLRNFNRHGLVAGATGTGKTKSLQLLAEGLSRNGVSVLMMDIKGDVSGISQAGIENPRITERMSRMKSDWKAEAFPVELLSISECKGVQMRATISEFGPVLLAKILGLNDTQSGVLSLVFKYCDDQALPLLDIADLRKALQYVSGDGKQDIENEYGLVSSSSIGAILRALVVIEEQGADLFFGEPSFDVKDLVRLDNDGRAFVHILKLVDLQSKPHLFSTFMLCLLAEIYESFPERGDKDAPELVIFIDEAHLVFKEASKALLNQMETIIKLIRSKGVGIFFCTQNPTDIPETILSQLGMKVQHALRAFTANDRKDIEQAAKNFPITEFYKTSDLLTELAIGEALITVLDEKGAPSPLVHCMMAAPSSRMDVISAKEEEQLLLKSQLSEKYNKAINRESAYELLQNKISSSRNKLEEQQQIEKKLKQDAKQAEIDAKQAERVAKELAKQKAKEEAEKAKEAQRTMRTIKNVATSSVTRTIVRELTRGLFGILKK